MKDRLNVLFRVELFSYFIQLIQLIIYLSLLVSEYSKMRLLSIIVALSTLGFVLGQPLPGGPNPLAPNPLNPNALMGVNPNIPIGANPMFVGANPNFPVGNVGKW